MSCSCVCSAEEWELGAVGGYGWYYNPSITNANSSARVGFPPRAAVGVVLGDDLFTYVGGEFRYLFRYGGPQVESNGNTASAPGYTNAITYDGLLYLTNRESKVRPFLSGGVGVKIFTGSGRSLTQPLAGLAVLREVSQVEPAISFGGGLKYLVARHMQLRADFRIYVTPLPDEVIRPVGLSTIDRWVFDFVPLGGISYVF
jgi:hypothetical protein